MNIKCEGCECDCKQPEGVEVVACPDYRSIEHGGKNVVSGKNIGYASE